MVTDNTETPLSAARRVCVFVDVCVCLHMQEREQFCTALCSVIIFSPSVMDHSRDFLSIPVRVFAVSRGLCRIFLRAYVL